MKNLTMDTIVNLCKNRGFIFPGSEIYGGFAECRREYVGVENRIG